MTQSFDETSHGKSVAQCALEQGLVELARAAAALGANALAVLLLEATSLEVVCRRTEAGEVLLAGAPMPCDFDVRVALENNSGPVSAKSSVARFLTAAIAPTANSFLLFPWRARPTGVTIVFGFEASEPAHAVPPHLRNNVNLVALAAWSLKEVGRLHAELRAANQSFAGRKLVERAKGILQSERGMSEQQAYEYLRRMSRQRRITISKLAEDLLGAGRWP